VKMYSEFLELLFAFNDRHVKYLLVGGYAFGVHAEPRATKDLDLWIRADEENSKAVFLALADFGAPLAGFTPADFDDDPPSVFQMGTPPRRVDILRHIDGVTFDEAWETRIETTVDGLTVYVISSELLIRNKLAAGHPRDLLDVEDIREAALERPGNNDVHGQGR
jgi:hypothetical protein